jgi:hypothetical protein
LSAKSGAGVLAERAAGGDEDIVVFGFMIDFCLWLLLAPLFLLPMPRLCVSMTPVCFKLAQQPVSAFSIG